MYGPSHFLFYMKLFFRSLTVLFVIVRLAGCADSPAPTPVALQLSQIRLGSYTLQPQAPNDQAPIGQPLTATFSAALDPASVPSSVTIRETTGASVALSFSFLDNGRTLSAQPQVALKPNQSYQLVISNSLKGTNSEVFPGITISFSTIPSPLLITTLLFDNVDALSVNPIVNIKRTPLIEVGFSHPVNPATVTSENFRVAGSNGLVPINLSIADGTRVRIQPTQSLTHLSRHQLWISADVQGTNQEPLTTFTRNFFTEVDPTPKFPILTDDQLLTLVQQQTFKYFWDFAQPNSGMARERNTSGDLVTAGGSGFGLMAIVVGIERGFVSRSDGLQRLNRILNFLETADRFHGAWAHWMNGNTGRVIPFSANDNGGDLVETAFLVQGLITFRQYLNPSQPEEAVLINRINTLWHAVEWDWYRRGNQNTLYWHWSPDKGWAMNMQIKGWNESLIVYTLAAASPTHTISKSVYDNGWASNGGMRNGNPYEGINLPLGPAFGGPLFFAHYSFLGLDPRGLSDAWCNDYFLQNRNHSLINQKYCIRNPQRFVGYSQDNWGLTASDNHIGYSAHSPTNDLGVITPTAALSSFPFTPDESMRALKFFYFTLGDRLWGDYGFYDAFNVTQNWTASSYLAIDQGPIVVMIENHRTGLLWDLFMSAPEVQTGLTKLGFTY
jgi:hypothetical protein